MGVIILEDKIKLLDVCICVWNILFVINVVYCIGNIVNSVVIGYDFLKVWIIFGKVLNKNFIVVFWLL